MVLPQLLPCHQHYRVLFSSMLNPSFFHTYLYLSDIISSFRLLKHILNSRSSPSFFHLGKKIIMMTLSMDK